MAESIVLKVFGEPEELAKQIANKFDTWKSQKQKIEKEWANTRAYIYATSTKDTINSKNPYKNTTTTPKLCQLFEQLYTLTFNIKFASGDFVEFVSAKQDEASKSKKETMNAYIKQLMEEGGFNNTALELDLDLYLYGNSFAKVEFERKINKSTNPFSQEEVDAGFVGARLVRVSPFDIVFNATASSFEKTPKIIRKVVDFATLKKQIFTSPDIYDTEVWEKVVQARQSFKGYSYKDQSKDQGFTMDGFGSLRDYMESGTVEVLEFYGDLYDESNDVLHENRTMIIVDRRYVILNKENNVELGEGLIFHNGDRKVPDNLWHKSRLGNLLGMQYLIDKFNNGKADGIDLITNPPIVEYGDVEPYKWGPGVKIRADDQSKVQQLPLDSKFLQANFEVNSIMQLMEQFAGLPSQAMGFKTKGEKTLGEVQMLENSALRQFNVRIQNQERKFWQPIVNCMMAQSRANLTDHELVKVVGQDGLEQFKTITKSDIAANGGFKAIGTSRFDKMLKLQGYLNTLMNSALMQDQTTKPHISGYELVKQFGELTGLDSRGVIGKNIGLDEQVDVQVYQAQLQQQLQGMLAQIQQPTQVEKDTELAAQMDVDTLELTAANSVMEMNMEGNE